MNNKRRTVEGARQSLPARLFYPSCERRDLFLAIANDVQRMIRIGNRDRGLPWRSPGFEAHFLDSRQQGVHPLVQGAGEHPIRHDDVETLNPWRPGKQIPVGRRQAKWINGPVGNSHDNVAIGPRGRFTYRPAPQFVLVVALFRAPALEVAKYRRKKSRLLNELMGTPVVGGTGLQHGERQTLERVDVLLTAPQVVVEPHHLGDQSRADAKGRFDAVGDDPTACNAKQDFALLGGQLAAGSRQPFGEPSDEFGCGREVRKNGGAGRGRIFDSANEMLGGSACRNDDEPVAGVERCPVQSEGDRRLAKRLETSDAYQACRAGSNHCSFGGSVRARNSFCASDSIISAPAAADDASQAVPMSADETALRRLAAAVSANRHAPLTSSCVLRRYSGTSSRSSRTEPPRSIRFSESSRSGSGPSSFLMDSSAGLALTSCTRSRPTAR